MSGLTDKQRLAKLVKAEQSLKKTTAGYTPGGVHWRTAMGLIDEVQESLRVPPKPPIPALGPIVAGGKSILLQDLTHATAGVPGFPAFDDGWVAGRAVIAPERLTVTRASGAQGGDAFFARGDSRIEYWIGHVAVAPAVGRVFVKGATMAAIARMPTPHVHCGINARPLTGKELEHHTNYTHGARLVGVQLRAAL